MAFARDAYGPDLPVFYDVHVGDVVPIAKRALALLHSQLERQLVEHSATTADIEGLVVGVAQWRSTARNVARELGRPIRTGVNRSADVVWAALTDWPATDEERERLQIAMREALNRLT